MLRLVDELYEGLKLTCGALVVAAVLCAPVLLYQYAENQAESARLDMAQARLEFEREALARAVEMKELEVNAGVYIARGWSGVVVQLFGELLGQLDGEAPLQRLRKEN